MTAANVTDPTAAATAAALFPPTIGDPNIDNSPPQEPTQQTPEQQRIAALEAQLAADRAAATERENRLLQSLDSLMTRTAAPAAEPAEPAAPAFSLDDLPDAVQAPTEFKTKLVEKVNNFVTGSVQSAQQQFMSQVTRAQALDAMWNRMSANPANAEYVKRPALVQGAAAITFNELRARGIDPVTLAAQNPDSLIGAIVQRMQAELGTPTASAATPGAGGARAATVAGGSGPTTPTNPTPPKIPTFIEQHQAARRAMGLV